MDVGHTTFATSITLSRYRGCGGKSVRKRVNPSMLWHKDSFF